MPNQITSSSLEALTDRYRMITYNLANASTVAFKRRHDEFSLGAAAGSGTDSGTGGTIETKSLIDFAQGHLVQTGRSLDIALDSKGFFVVEGPEGKSYTRNGTFRLSPEGQLVDFAGRTVAGENGPITVPNSAGPSSVHVDKEGNVSVDGRKIGKLQIMDFEKPSDLIPAGDSSFQAQSDDLATAVTGTSVHQGFSEASNVNIAEELVDLIMVTRTYEANFRSINVEDERLKNLLDVAMS